MNDYTIIELYALVEEHRTNKNIYCSLNIDFHRLKSTTYTLYTSVNGHYYADTIEEAVKAMQYLYEFNVWEKEISKLEEELNSKNFLIIETRAKLKSEINERDDLSKYIATRKEESDARHNDVQESDLQSEK
ncbi:MAG: hypothetical protein HOK80_09185 [Candidatus Cloacimonetes bacterium]|jgi:hypothetical protein|nr:hypothetical protein [Candidatus Cloacimonadota bacterium]